MNIDLRIRYFTKDHEWLCFRHAVKKAIMAGQNVETEIDEFNDYSMISTRCGLCSEEERDEEKRWEEKFGKDHSGNIFMEAPYRSPQPSTKIRESLPEEYTIKLINHSNPENDFNIETVPLILFYHSCCKRKLEAKITDAMSGKVLPANCGCKVIKIREGRLCYPDRSEVLDVKGDIHREKIDGQKT